MSSSIVQSHTIGSLSCPPPPATAVTECHHHNSGPVTGKMIVSSGKMLVGGGKMLVGGISDLDGVNQGHYRASAMTPPPQMPSSPW